MQHAIALSPTRGPFAPLFFQGDVMAGIEAAARAGFDAVELSVRAPEDIDVTSLRTALTASSLSVSALATGKAYYEDGLSLLDPDAEVRAAARERVASLVALAAELRARAVVIGGVRGRLAAGTSAADAHAVLADAVAALSDEGARAGVALLLEPINRYETDVLNTADSAAAIVEAVGRDNVGLLLDTFHMNLEETSIVATLVRHRRHLRYVHLADNRRRVPGEGSVPFLEWLRVLLALTFDGTVGVEALPLPSDERAVRDAGDALRRWKHQLVQEAANRNELP